MAAPISPEDPELIAAPGYEIVADTPRWSAAEERGAAIDARVDALTRSFSYARVFAVAEAVVTSAEALVMPTTRAGNPEMIATRYTFDVVRSWKSKLPETIEVWSYGGQLPDDVAPDFRPRGTSISGEAHFTIGEHVIIAASDSYTIKSEPKKWHILNGDLGTLRVGEVPEIESAIRTFLDTTFERFVIDPSPPAPSASDKTIYFTVDETWCNRYELGVDFNRLSFQDRGFDIEAMDGHTRTGLTWWNDSQTDAKFHIDTWTTSTTMADPGPVYAVCCETNPLEDDPTLPCEDPYFRDNPGAIAYTARGYHFGTPCELWGKSIDKWKIAVWANAPENQTDSDNVCGETDAWHTHWGDPGQYKLFEVLGHEFGHVLGMGHDESLYWNALMQPNEPLYGDLLFSHQEVLGQTAMYGTEHGYLRTVTASYVAGNNGELVFDQVQTLTPFARWKPVIDANNGPWDTWDYALA